MAELLGPRIGIFICGCGGNISSVVNVAAICDIVKKWDKVIDSKWNLYLCSKPAQDMILESIVRNKLNRVVVACCTPRMHLPTFQSVLERAGLNPYMLEFVNIREHCSWVHGEQAPAEATKKAINLIRGGYERSFNLEPLEPVKRRGVREILVVGGGIAGITASLKLSKLNHTVYLVEIGPTIGGHMAKLTKTFPTLDCAQCILAPKMAEVARDPNIKLFTNSEIIDIGGSPGDFLVRIVKYPRYVDEAKCTGCGKCGEVCPVLLPDEFNQGLGNRKAIYRPFPQAVPSSFIIDKKGVPPCKAACPANVNVQAFVALIRQRKFKEALDVIRKELPLPGVCGRVCFRPCEAECARGKVDEPVAIGALKRFVFDYEAKLNGLQSEPIPKTREEKIAIVGSGPAGLAAAYDLIRKGYHVTVFEAMSEPGGMLRLIPDYRLPKKVLNAEIKFLKDLGVEFKTNTLIGRDITIRQLLQSGYRAVFIAIGAQKNIKLNVEGEELSGVIYALDFLKKVSNREKVEIGEKVAVIGGGNVAIDASRVALRMGAKNVVILYRRSREEMPAYPPEIEEAEKEGVKFMFLVAPLRILGKDGKVTGIECIRMELGEPDESGRRRPIPVTGSEFVIEVNTAIVAIGQQPDLSMLPDEIRVEKGVIKVDPVTLETSMPNVFAGGDAVSGPSTVIEAIATGKRAAISIDRLLNGKDLRVDREEKIERVKELPIVGVKKKVRQIMPLLSYDKRIGNFNEVELGFTEEMAVDEAERCLQCGGCSECHICESVCEAKAINHQQKEEFLDLRVGAIILATGYECLDVKKITELGYGFYPDVITMMDLERMISLSGPTGGEIKRLSNGNRAKRVAIVLCVGSRDEKYAPYCSRICCMYSLKNAIILKEMIGADVWVYYTDIRASGRGYEELYRRAQKAGVIFVRGKVGEVRRAKNGKMEVVAEDTLSGKYLEEEFDLVVLAPAIIPASGLEKLTSKLRIPLSADGFIQERHPKLDPVSSLITGVFACGCVLGPKDIRDTVSDALAAAVEAASFLSRDYITTNPEKAFVKSDICDGCGECIKICPFNAITIADGKAKIDPFICTGWGACVPTCPRGAIDVKNSTERQIISTLKGVLHDKDPEEIRIVAFVDKIVGYAALDFLGLDRINYPLSIYIVPIASTAMLGIKQILSALALGADGVLIIEGQEYIDAKFTREKFMGIGSHLKNWKIEPMRIRYAYIPLPSYKKCAEIFNRYVRNVEKFLGPLPKETRNAIKNKLSFEMQGSW